MLLAEKILNDKGMEENMWLWMAISALACIVAVLSMKIYLLQKAAREIRDGLAEKLVNETNTLLTLSSHDKYMQELAAGLNDELRRLRRQRIFYEQGDLRLKEAVTNISHDIRTPLTAICGYLELLESLFVQMQEKEPEQKEQIETAKRYLEIIENRTDILKQLTEELLQYSVILAKEEEIPYEEVVLNHILEESVSAYYAALKNAKITPDIYMPERDVKCKLNKELTSRIFSNIISNAIKYSDGDLRIVLSENGGITFSNCASGLDEVQTGKLFDRFYTVEAAVKSTGLGLSIAKALTEQMGGSISAQYEAGMLMISISFSGRIC